MMRSSPPFSLGIRIGVCFVLGNLKSFLMFFLEFIALASPFISFSPSLLSNIVY